MSRIRLVVTVVALTGALVQIPAYASLAQRPSPVDGTWDYALTPGYRGWSLWDNGHYVLFNTRADSAPAPGPLTDSVRAKIYRVLNLNAGTFTVSDTIVSCEQLYGKDPRQAPRKWRWSFVIKGDTMWYNVLNEQGQRTSSGKSVRVR